TWILSGVIGVETVAPLGAVSVTDGGPDAPTAASSSFRVPRATRTVRPAAASWAAPPPTVYRPLKSQPARSVSPAGNGDQKSLMITLLSRVSSSTYPLIGSPNSGSGEASTRMSNPLCPPDL